MSPTPAPTGANPSMPMREKMARAIALATYSLALKMSKDPNCRSATPASIAAVFEDAWQKDIGDARCGMTWSPL